VNPEIDDPGAGVGGGASFNESKEYV